MARTLQLYRPFLLLLLSLWLQLQLIGRIACDSHVYIVTLDDEPLVTKFAAPGPHSPNGNMAAKFRNVDAKLYANYLIDKHDSILARTLEPESYEKLYSHTHVVNGFSVKLNNDQVKLITKAHGVQRVYKSRRAKLDTTHTPTFLDLDGGGAWLDVGGKDDAGEGVVIGMVDGGIDGSHPSFQNNDPSKPYSPTLPHFHGHCDIGPMFPKGSCNGKIIGARFFNKAFKASGEFNASQDFESPYDQDGHGTHTSSIAAGNSNVPIILNDVNFGNASGMAPRARIAVYRCLYLFGGEEADVVAAIDQAVQDGVNVFSISLNFDADDNPTSFLNPFYVALLHAAKAGIFTANSAGNNGPRPSSMRANAPWVMTVGATTTDRVYPEGLILGNNVNMTSGALSPGTPGENMYQIISAEHARIKGGYDDLHTGFPCEKSANYNKSLVEGKLLLCIIPNREPIDPELSNSVLMAVARTARELGAAGLIWDVSNASDQGMQYFIVDLPTFVLNDNVESLKAFYDYMKSTKNPMGRIFCDVNGEFTARAPTVTSFSARGPAYAHSETEEPINLLKPNIVAPGKDIWAAYSLAAPFEIGPAFAGQRFAYLSGTSMAAPHVAGVAALIRQKYPTWSPAAIASALSTTATTHDKWRMPIANDGSMDHPHANPFDYGSGFLNAKDSLDPGFVFDAGFEDYIGFTCSVPDVDGDEVYRAIGIKCHSPKDKVSDMNMPSFVVTHVGENTRLRRKIMSVGEEEEMYVTQVSYHHYESLAKVAITPQNFTLAPNSSLDISIDILVAHQEPTTSSIHHQHFQFGHIMFRGNQGHSPTIPFAISLAP